MDYLDIVNAFDIPFIAVVAFYLLTAFRKTINKNTEAITVLISKINGMKGGLK